MLEILFRYKYWLLFGFFILWMLFFDSNNVFYRFNIAKEISDIEESIKAHKKSIGELHAQRKDVLGNQRSIEKFAREKYLFKKDNEDVFVIEIDSTGKK